MLPVKGLTVWSYYAVTLSVLATKHFWNAEWKELISRVGEFQLLVRIYLGTH